jgi:hypothetical protein
VAAQRFWLIRTAATIGAIVAAFLLPISLLGGAIGVSELLMGASDLQSSSPSPFARTSLSVGLWMLLGGVGGLIGFAGLALCALLPRRLLGGNRWARGCRHCAILWSFRLNRSRENAAPLGHRASDPMQFVLLSLPLLGCALIGDVTANPSLQQTD